MNRADYPSQYLGYFVVQKSPFQQQRLDRIPTSEVEFHPHSFADQRMRLFSWNGQIYRGINGAYVPLFTNLFERRIIQGLVDKGFLVDSEVSPLKFEGYEIVVRHRRLRFISYPNEWCAAMLKDGALKILDLALELGKDGFTLADAHPWNLLYDVDSAKLVFVDLGSITSITDFSWPVYYEFCKFCFYPLLLMSYEQEQIARLLMCEKSGVRESDLAKMTGFRSLSLSSRYCLLLRRMESSFAQNVPTSCRQWLTKVNPIQILIPEGFREWHFQNSSLNLRQRFHRSFLEAIRRDVEKIDVSCDYAGTQATLAESEFSLSSQSDWTPQQHTIHKLMTELQPQTVLDVGSDVPWYSQLAALLGSQVVYWNTDPVRVTQLYQNTRSTGLSILPLLMDFAQPTPSRGLANCWSIAATDRFTCDMVLVLGTLHRIVREGRLSFEQIVEGLALLSKQWVIVEFVAGAGGKEDKGLGFLQSAKYSWYTLNNFLDAARKKFSRVATIHSSEKTNPLVLCVKPH